MAAGLLTSFSIPTWASGAVLSVLLGLVILGGIQRIAAVAATLVPFMGLLYAFGALAVIATHAENLLPSFLSVLRDAFSGSAATGGFLGATFAYAFNRGVNRGLYSNEAGARFSTHRSRLRTLQRTCRRGVWCRYWSLSSTHSSSAR